MSELQECYATVSTPFGAGGELYDGAGHRGTDYKRTARQTVIAYDDMIVDEVGESRGLGYVLGLRRLTIGGFAGFAHVVDLPPLGARIPKGNVVALVAGYGDEHGTLWTGPHIHTTQSDVSAYNAAYGVRPLTDPAPTIATAVGGSSTAGGGYRPITSSTITNGDIMRYKATSASSDGVIREGDSFLQGAEGPLRLLTLDETLAYQYNDEHGRPTPYAEWSGQKLRSLVKVAGLRAYDGTGKPTGKIKY